MESVSLYLGPAPTPSTPALSSLSPVSPSFLHARRISRPHSFTHAVSLSRPLSLSLSLSLAQFADRVKNFKQLTQSLEEKAESMKKEIRDLKSTLEVPPYQIPIQRPI